MKNIVIVTAFALLLVSCVSQQISTPVPYKPAQTIGNMGFFPVLIGKITRPPLPLIDAAAFNSKTNQIADQIMDMQKKTIDRMRENGATTLKKYFNCEVIFGDALHNMPSYTDLSQKYNYKSALAINDDNFPLITISSGDINPFNYVKADVPDFFKNSSNYEETIKILCSQLNLDAIAISYSKLAVTSVTAFGISGYTRLETTLYIIDKNGKMIANGTAFTKPVTIPGNDIGDYQMRLDDFPIIFEQLISKLVAAPQK
jgi:hypothetical protein